MDSRHSNIPTKALNFPVVWKRPPGVGAFRSPQKDSYKHKKGYGCATRFSLLRELSSLTCVTNFTGVSPSLMHYINRAILRF